MKHITNLLLIISTYGCYNTYGLAFQEKTSNHIPSKAHTNSALNAAVKVDGVPASIIFIIADGTGIGQYTVSYYANGKFAPSRFDHVGLVATHPIDEGCDTGCKLVTDSAAGGTALSTGKKTSNGAVSVDLDKKPIKTMLEWAKEKGMSTGLVATSTVTHATPASFGAHVDSRKKEKKIARQLADADIDVILGGGKRFWSDALIANYESRGGQYIRTIDTEFDPSKRILGLFSQEALPKAHEGRRPTTTQMAKLALSKLETDPDGFFIMIEESQIDWGGHSNSAEYLRSEMESLNELVNFSLDYQAKHPEVLVILTSDHECGGVAVHDGKNGNLDVRFTSDYHSANFVPVWATGPGASAFDAFMDNTEIGKTLIEYIRQ